MGTTSKITTNKYWVMGVLYINQISFVKLIGLYWRVNEVCIDVIFSCRTDLAKLSLCLINTPWIRNVGDFLVKTCALGSSALHGGKDQFRIPVIFLGINIPMQSLNSSLGGQNAGLTDRAKLIITDLRIIKYKGRIIYSHYIHATACFGQYMWPSLGSHTKRTKRFF